MKEFMNQPRPILNSTYDDSSVARIFHYENEHWLLLEENRRLLQEVEKLNMQLKYQERKHQNELKFFQSDLERTKLELSLYKSKVFESSGKNLPSKNGSVFSSYEKTMIEPTITVSVPNGDDVFNHDMMKINTRNSEGENFDSSSSSEIFLPKSRKRRIDFSITDEQSNERESFVDDSCNCEDFEMDNVYSTIRHFKDVENPLNDVTSKSDLQVSSFSLHPFNEFSPMKRKKCQG